MKFGKIKKIACTLMIACTLFTVPAYAHQTLGVKSFVEQGINYRTETRIKRIVYYGSGLVSKVMSHTTFRLDPDGSEIFIQNKSDVFNENDILDYYWGSKEIPIYVNTIVYEYEPDENGQPMTVFTDIRDKCYKIPGRFTINIDIGGQSSNTGTQSGQSSGGGKTQTSQQTSGSNQGQKSGNTGSSGGQSNQQETTGTHEGKDANGVYEKYTSDKPYFRVASKDTVFYGISDIKIEFIGQKYGVQPVAFGFSTSKDKYPDSWYQYMDNIKYDKVGTYYLFLVTKDSKGGNQFYIYGPFSVKPLSEKPQIPVVTQPGTGQQQQTGSEEESTSVTGEIQVQENHDESFLEGLWDTFLDLLKAVADMFKGCS